MNTGYYPDTYEFVNEFFGSYGYSTGINSYSELIEFAPKILLKLYMLFLKMRRDFSNLFDLDEFDEVFKGIGSLNFNNYFKKANLTADNYMAYDDGLENGSEIGYTNYLTDSFYEWTHEMQAIAYEFAYLILRFSFSYVSMSDELIDELIEDFDSSFIEFIQDESSVVDSDFALISSPYFVFLETISELDHFKNNRRLSADIASAYASIATIGELMFYNPEDSYQFFCRSGERPSFVNLDSLKTTSDQANVINKLAYGVAFSNEMGGTFCLESPYFINVLLELRLIFEGLIDAYAEIVPRIEIIETYNLI